LEQQVMEAKLSPSQAIDQLFQWKKAYCIC
jgi:hypothetical protein